MASNCVLGFICGTDAFNCEGREPAKGKLCKFMKEEQPYTLRSAWTCTSPEMRKRALAACKIPLKALAFLDEKN